MYLRLAIRQSLDGTTWLDLFAGTGAVGIEALSRGASHVYFVDMAGRSINQIRDNLKSLKIETGFTVIQKDVIQALRELESLEVRGDFAFLDPPYESERSYRDSLQMLSSSATLKTTGTVIAEHSKSFDPPNVFNCLVRYRKLEQGDSALSFYRKEISPSR